MKDHTKSIKGSQTEKNIVTSYINECQAYSRYTFYAQAADKEQYFPVGEVFRATALNELRHAKVFLKMLEDNSVTVPITADAGFLGATADNLATAIKEERADGYEFYDSAAKTAIAEGFPDIASHFKAIASVELRHHDRFQRCLDLIKAGKLWERAEPIEWQCLVCGYIHTGLTPPQVCPACDHPYQHYMPLDILM